MDLTKIEPRTPNCFDYRIYLAYNSTLKMYLFKKGIKQQKETQYNKIKNNLIFTYSCLTRFKGLSSNISFGPIPVKAAPTALFKSFA